MSVACAALPRCAPFDEEVLATIHRVGHESFHVLTVDSMRRVPVRATPRFGEPGRAPS
jgi:hypothetical protein